MTAPPSPSQCPPTQRRSVWGCGLLLSMLLGACAHDYGVENRETPVHVWLTAPGFVTAGGEVQALIYVGSQKVVDGVVTFAPGVGHVQLPTVFLSTGDKVVSAVLDGGAMSATKEIEIEGESWVNVVVRPPNVEIRQSDDAPEIDVR